jgi:hypothetical protein
MRLRNWNLAASIVLLILVAGLVRAFSDRYRTEFALKSLAITEDDAQRNLPVNEPIFLKSGKAVVVSFRPGGKPGESRKIRLHLQDTCLEQLSNHELLGSAQSLPTCLKKGSLLLNVGFSTAHGAEVIDLGLRANGENSNAELKVLAVDDVFLGFKLAISACLLALVYTLHRILRSAGTAAFSEKIKVLSWLIVIILGFIARIASTQSNSPDMPFFLNWWDQLATDGYEGLSARLGIYTALYYYYLLTLVSIFKGVISPVIVIKWSAFPFELLLTYFVFKFVRQTCSLERAKWAAVTVFVSPGLIGNGSLWGQCDAIYTSLVMGSLYYLCQSRQRAAAISFAAAFCFKLQSAFAAPMLFVMYMRRRFHVSYLFFPIWAFLICSLPAWIAGADFFRFAFAYSRQVSSRAVQSYTFQPALAAIFDPSIDAAHHYRILSSLFTIGLIIAVTNFASTRKRLTDTDMLEMTLFFALFIPFFMPASGARYFFLAEMLIIPLAFVRPGITPAALVVTFLSALCYLRALGQYYSGVVLPALCGFVILYFAWRCFALEGKSSDSPVTA